MIDWFEEKSFKIPREDFDVNITTPGNNVRVSFNEGVFQRLFNSPKIQTGWDEDKRRLYFKGSDWGRSVWHQPKGYRDYTQFSKNFLPGYIVGRIGGMYHLKKDKDMYYIEVPE